MPRRSPRRTSRRPAEAPRTEVVAGIELELVVKPIKRINLRVSPPDGRVRVSVPRGTPRAAIDAAVRERSAWIARHQQRFRALPQPAPALCVTGEVHYFRGEPYRLELRPGAPRRVTLEEGRLVMGIGPDCDRPAREKRLENWYRRQLSEALPDLLATWAPRFGVPAPDTGIKRMRTRWGSCNPRARRIWLNVALVRRRPELLEYVVVHELAHLLVADHGPRFRALMTRHMPHWRRLDAELDAWPLWARLPADAPQPGAAPGLPDTLPALR